MNEKQRDYLIKKVDTTFNQQMEKLDRQEPQKPSLNNYLIAAFLDNTIQFASIDVLKKKMKARVLKMGHGDSLVDEEDEDGYSIRRRRGNKNGMHVVKCTAEDLFILPKGYAEAYDKYKNDHEEWEKKCEGLRAVHETIETKIRLGSDEVLAKLIAQADNLVDLNIVNAQLVISPMTDQKQIESKNKK